jgi:hypothetical protein
LTAGRIGLVKGVGWVLDDGGAGGMALGGCDDRRHIDLMVRALISLRGEDMGSEAGAEVTLSGL